MGDFWFGLFCSVMTEKILTDIKVILLLFLDTNQANNQNTSKTELLPKLEVNCCNFI